MSTDSTTSSAATAESRNFALAKERLETEKAALLEMRASLLSASCFNVTKDVGVLSGNPLTGTTDDPAASAPHYEDWIYQEALQIDPRIAGQGKKTLAQLLASAEQVIDADARRELIMMSSHFGMLDLFASGVREKTIEYRRRTSKGPKWVSTQLILMRDPESQDVMAFFYTRDITDRKIDERVMRLTFERGCDWVALIDVANETVSFRYMSPAIATVAANWNRDVALDYYENMERSILGLTRPEDHDHLRTLTNLTHIVGKLDEAGSCAIAYDLHMPFGMRKRKQVSYCWFDDEHTHILATQTDVTVAYEHEQEQMRQLEEALQVARQANEAKTEFIRRISHDIRTPIGAISNLTQFAMDDIGDRERLIDDLRKIETSNKFLLSLINDVLDISRIDRGKISLSPEPYPKDEYIDNIRNIMEPMCAEKGLTFVLESEATCSGSAIVDKVRLNQIALNILSNAAKYTPAGGTVTYRSLSYDIEGGRRRLMFEVEDTGIGMSEEFQAHMFEEFSQEYNNPARPMGITGTGLGLSIAKHMLDLMGGTITVKSELGKGTLIRIALDVDQQVLHPEDEPDDLTCTADAHRKLTGQVLLAEDNDINAMIATRILEDFGLEVARAADGVQAVEMVRDAAPKTYIAVLMDIQMPNMDGYEATKAIRALGRRDAREIPIVAMTADAFESALKKAREVGMTDYLTKPIEENKLFGVLAKYVR